MSDEAKPTVPDGPFVHQLAGMLEARQWASGVVADVKLFKDGKLAWKSVDGGCVIHGPPGTGKTTLALAATGDAIDLDLELERDRARLDPAAIHLSDHLDKLVIPDEGRPAPGLFPVSRGLIDCSRRAGRAAKLAGTASSTGASRREQ